MCVRAKSDVHDLKLSWEWSSQHSCKASDYGVDARSLFLALGLRHHSSQNYPETRSKKTV